ncbi:uncharacterized protein LOC132141762 [Carassius carassius]|uniref:uncharacterized protein LOC132141762 n=1 Tax=Carassius carassius TaxID=217509 RepID=UPI0028685850|nr:uncharacterized protein LOC132141762 [Carassius carassius]
MVDSGKSVNKDMKVFVVDSQALPPPVSVRKDGPQLSVMYLLLAVALLGVFIEAGLILHLYSRPAVSPHACVFHAAHIDISYAQLTLWRSLISLDHKVMLEILAVRFSSCSSGDIRIIIRYPERGAYERREAHASQQFTWLVNTHTFRGLKMGSVFIRLVFSTDSNEVLPEKPPKAESKPAAFLQIASPPFSRNGVLPWRYDSFTVFLRGLGYKNNSLHIQQDGYYYIFSKISHMENCNFFKHQVMQRTERYNSKAIELMQSSRFICVTNLSQSRGNSYLGGIFHLLKGDSVFVMVSNSSQVHGDVYENFFGAFMV